MKKVGIIMGSKSDLTVMQEAAGVLDAFGIPYEMTIVSAHRTPERMFDYAKSDILFLILSNACFFMMQIFILTTMEIRV